MSHQSIEALPILLRMQATRDKQRAALHPATMERIGCWFRVISVPAPAPPWPAADPFSQLSEVEGQAMMYPDRAARIREAGRLPADLDFGALTGSGTTRPRYRTETTSLEPTSRDNVERIEPNLRPPAANARAACP